MRLPKDATYLSDDSQKESMSVLADLVHQKIADELKTGKYFTIMVDGTTDKSGQEIQGLVVRFY